MSDRPQSPGTAANRPNASPSRPGIYDRPEPEHTPTRVVGVYDRPERTGPPPILWVAGIVVLVLLVALLLIWLL